MPIYEYGCRGCGHEFEAMQKMSDKPLKRCPQCGDKVGRLISHSSFVLKGTGWYVTDYAKKKGSSGGNGKESGGEKHAEQTEQTEKAEKAEKKESVAKTDSSGGETKTTTKEKSAAPVASSTSD